MYAAYRGETETVKALLGNFFNSEKILRKFLASDLVDATLRDVCGNSALYIAIAAQKSKSVELLIKDTGFVTASLTANFYRQVPTFSRKWNWLHST
jgi:hypothetical protein